MIRVRGAREHNLRGLDLDLPTGSFIVCTGVSGSGKSSFAFDTVYAEASRRFVEALAPEARSRLGRMKRPTVSFIDGLPPAIGVSQRGKAPPGARATVGSEAELDHLLHVVWSTLGTLHCPKCGTASQMATPDAMVRELLAMNPGSRLTVLAPVARGAAVAPLLRELPRQGFVRVRLDGVQTAIDDLAPVDDRVPHDLDVVIDRLRLHPPEHEQHSETAGRIAEAISTAMRVGRGAGRGEVVVEIVTPETPAGAAVQRIWGVRGRCATCSTALPELSPRLYSTSSPRWACGSCEGVGTVRTVDPQRLIADPARSLMEGAVEGGKAVRDAALRQGLPVDRAWRDLTWEEQDFVLRGGPGWEGAVRRATRLAAGDRATERISLATREDRCAACEGTGLGPFAASVTAGGATLPALLGSPIAAIQQVFQPSGVFGSAASAAAAPLIDEIRRRLDFLVRVGLGHLCLAREARTLSTGEIQRVRIAAQAGNQLSGVLFVFDEPTAGLHPDDTAQLLEVLLALRSAGNTVLVVEHDPLVIQAADWVIDIGPGAGPDGGALLYEGPPAGLVGQQGPTARWLDGRDVTPAPLPRADRGALTLIGARGRNLADANPAGVDLIVPLGQVTAVTGRSGVGKSTLVLDTLAVAVARHLGAWAEPLPFERIDGMQRISRLVRAGVASAPRSERSLPVTLLKIWAEIRGLYARTPLAKVNGWGPEHWSLHTAGSGRCALCEGEGTRHIDLHYLPEVALECEACEGKRYDDATLSVLFHGLSMADVLALPARDAKVLFQHHSAIAGPLRLLDELGLGYLPLGQPASTLSGGEHQRIQLARELGKPGEVNGTLYVLDEPSIGLHPADIQTLLHALHRLADAGGTVLLLDTDPALVTGCDQVVTLRRA